MIAAIRRSAVYCWIANGSLIARNDDFPLRSFAIVCEVTAIAKFPPPRSGLSPAKILVENFYKAGAAKSSFARSEQIRTDQNRSDRIGTDQNRSEQNSIGSEQT
ncbi:MAG: hypothetical protein LBU73_01285, partial [Helicobacteraceae bacterium]|nr:hypothetical protein [Helicobacteraceae bacterium]